MISTKPATIYSNDILVLCFISKKLDHISDDSIFQSKPHDNGKGPLDMTVDMIMGRLDVGHLVYSLCNPKTG